MQQSVGSVAPWNNVDQTYDEDDMTKVDDTNSPLQVKEEKLNMEEAKNNEQQMKKTKNSYKINTTKARSELKLLRKIIFRNGWKEEHLHDDQGDIMWFAMGLQSEDYSSCFRMHTNRFPGMRDLAHKDQTAFFLNKFREYFPDDFDFFPRSFMIPNQMQAFEKEFKENKDNFYISKPDAGSQGDGIYIIKQFKDINQSKGQVIQEYIAKPLLIDGKKFDLRIYVLISSLEPYICYLNDEGLARFCTENYETPTAQNLNNQYMHLTNYSINKDSPNFVLQTTDLLEKNLASKRTISSVKKNLTEMGFDVEQIDSDIKDIVVKLLTSLHPFLLFNFKAAFQGKTNEAKCFHILGLDVMLDEEAKPWLLEVNGNPSLNIEHEFSSPIKNGKPITEISAVDDYVKTQVAEDAIAIIVRSPQKQLDNIGVGESFYSYKMIIGGEVESEEKDLVNNILKIYGFLSGYKFRESLTASKFIKLATFPGMTNSQILKVDYDLLFRKVLLKDSNHDMNFFMFIEAIERLASKLIPDFDEDEKLTGVTELVDKILGFIS